MNRITNNIINKIILSCLVIVQTNAHTHWAALTTITLNNTQRTKASTRTNLVFEKKLPLAANQLLISWNIMRPARGYFSIHLQVFDKQLRQWSPWYKIALWGAHVQRSFDQKYQAPLPSFHSVRFHLPTGQYASFARIHIQAHDGAKLNNVYQISLCAINTELFTPEAGKGKTFSFKNIHISGVPRVSQIALEHPDKARICSPTSLSMVVSYLNNKPESPYAFADGVFDTGLRAYGSWPFNTAHAFQRCNGAYYFAVARLNSFAHLYHYLEQQLPIVVSVRGQMRGMPAGKTYEDGHLLVVVGWDNAKKQVLCHDPAFESNDQVLHRYDINDFLTAWERSISPRLAYVVEPRTNS